ncbi:MAG: prepilin-type N-terminal cleavage/methylation domain-containing protein [Planctomycetes bacterium]|nr:prepilin-type N-terminal cleavage/methylation domain-containing protein [Planctomycetota bacterium]
MTRTTPNARTAGFTLIEVLLAIAITATVMVTVGTTFHVMLNARDVVDDMTESTEAGPRILNLIERDLRGIWTYNVKNNAVFRGRDMDVGGRDADRMDFLTTTDAVGFVLDAHNQPRKPTLCEVGYWFKPNPRYRDVFEMWRREDPMVDGDLITQGSFQLVHDRVKSFKVTYYETLGHEAEELLEWDSSFHDNVPARIKIEFTIERRRSSRNIVSDVEVEDFEGAERTYVRHFVFDRRLNNLLRAGTARMPVFPIEPEAEQGAGPAGPAGGGGAAGGKDAASMLSTTAGDPNKGMPTGRREQNRTTTTEFGPGASDSGPRGPRGGGAGAGSGSGGSGGSGGGGLPPGFNLSDLLRGLGGGGGGGGGGLFGGG